VVWRFQIARIVHHRTAIFALDRVARAQSDIRNRSAQPTRVSNVLKQHDAADQRSEIPLTVRASAKTDTVFAEYFCTNLFFHFLARIRPLSIALHNLYIVARNHAGTSQLFSRLCR
jgi:hypothetical protein